MKIKNATLLHMSKGGFLTRDGKDGDSHVKTLPYLSIVEAVEGDYSIALATGATHHTGSHGFFIAPAHVPQTIRHYRDPSSGRAHCRWIFLDLQLNELYSPEELFSLPETLTGTEAEPMHRLFDELFATDQRLSELSLAYAIAAQLLTHAAPLPTPLPSPLAASLRYIRENYRSPISVAQLAEVERMSESNYYAVFRRVLGVSPIAYLNHYRITLAAELLETTNRSIASIAASVGIPDALYFSKLFFRTYRASPTQYRKRMIHN